MRLDLEQLLEFYDYKVEDSDTHASAINAVLGEDVAVELMRNYFEALGFKFQEAEPCTQGKQAGHRLDRWIYIERDSEESLYQVEIKNWSAHSIGGRRVPRNPSEEEMKKFRLDRWRKQFDVATNIPTQKETVKVLTPMLAPRKFERLRQKPMLCFWEPMHPFGCEDEFMSAPIADPNFETVFVFSMSNHIRRLLREKRYLEISSKTIDDRLGWLNKIYCTPET
jgi:hypothetical protein